VQIAAVSAPSGILQQPGEPFTRPQPGQVVWFGLQHSSLPFIWPQSVQSSTLAAMAVPALLPAVPRFLQPLVARTTPTEAIANTIVRNFLFTFITSSFQINHRFFSPKPHNDLS
jgi:hypothetical protein